jgi:hypothetical protein
MVSIVACNRAAQVNPQNIPVTDVLNQLKLELAAFIQDTEGKQYNFGPRCGGTGSFSMRVKNVEVNLKTEISLTAGADVAVSAPIGVVTLGPSGGGSLAYDNSQAVTLSFSLDTRQEPVPSGTKPPSLNLARALAVLRDQILAVAPAGQCLTFTADNNKIELAFTAERDLNGGIKLSVAVLTLDATVKSTNKSGNTLTVALDMAGTAAFAPPNAPPPPARTRQ